MLEINVAVDFSRYPAGRIEEDGPYSGAAFRKKFLEPALKKKEVICVNLDGTRGYGSSFLEEAFGGLVRCGYSKDEINQYIKITSNDKTLIIEIKEYVEEEHNRTS